MQTTTGFERLLVLTLSLEEALGSEQWEHVSSLLDERAQVLATLPSTGVTPADKLRLEQTEAAQLRCVKLLQSQRTEVATMLAEGLMGRRMRATYGSTDERPGGLRIA